MSMTIEEVSTLLTTAASFDRRTIAKGDIEAWYGALYGLDFTACTAAVIYHYGRETDIIMPAHIRRIVTPAAPEVSYELPSNPTSKPDYWRERGDQDVVLWADKNKTNRELVCRFPDIAAKLAEPPYLGTPTGWSGFIPSTEGPVRTQLLALVEEAAHRADAAAADHHPADQIRRAPWQK